MELLAAFSQCTTGFFAVLGTVCMSLRLHIVCEYETKVRVGVCSVGIVVDLGVSFYKRLHNIDGLNRDKCCIQLQWYMNAR